MHWYPMLAAARALRPEATGKLCVLFGGGERDPGKREMGQAYAKLPTA